MHLFAKFFAIINSCRLLVYLKVQPTVIQFDTSKYKYLTNRHLLLIDLQWKKKIAFF